MNITGFLLLAACLHVSARGYTQKVTLSGKDMPLEKVFNIIERQTGYAFFYDFDIFKDTHKVTLNVKDMNLDEVLKACLRDQPLLDFRITNTTISIIRKKTTVAPAQPTIVNRDKDPFDFRGTVTDENGQPLSGATVKLKNGKVAAITDERGDFKLKNINEDEVVEISYTGYILVELPVKKEALRVSLKRATNKLDEVQVIAYGTSTQRLSTGNISKVTSKEIEEQPVPNPLAALQGRVPGLIVTQTTGAPGGGFKVQIRGKNSISNGTDPYYVIDGVPYNSQIAGIPTNDQNAGPLLNPELKGGSPLNFINPYDIESIEVLKDADATAIYGSRAANGAILITTKKGKIGSMRIDLNAYTGITSLARDIKLLNTQQYLAMRHEAFNNDKRKPGPADYDINGVWDTTRYTDWSKIFLHDAGHYSDAQANVSGGNANTQYLIGVGYYRQDMGVPKLLPGVGADQKASAHFNINSSSSDKKFKLALTGSYVADRNTVQTANFSSLRLTLAPDAPALFNPDGSLNWAPLTPGVRGTWNNPYATLLGRCKGNTSNLVGNLTLSYILLKGLELRTTLGYSNSQTDELATAPVSSLDPGLHVTTGISQFNTLNNHSWIVEPQLDYKMELGKGTITALIGGSFHQANNSYNRVFASGFLSDALLEDIASAGSLSPSSSSTQYRYEAVFGRLSYNLQDKYLLNLTARRDGSSRFGPGRQFANFGAVGAGWIFTRENFIQKSLPFLSFGKIRASYGTTGNDQIADYGFLDLYTPTSFVYQGNRGVYPQNLFNPDLAWETTKKLEGALELGFFKDRILIQASFYRNRSGNELVRTPISAVTGFAVIQSNLPALVQNSGKEFVLNTINIKTTKFSWSSSFNLTIARNKLVAFPNLANSSYSTSLIIGQPISILKVYHFKGVNDTTGVYQFASAKGGNTYSPDYYKDAIPLDLTPKFYGGFLNSFTYKGFNLDFAFQFVKQQGQNQFAAFGLMPGMMDNLPEDALNRWQSPGDKKPYQQFSQTSGKASTAFRFVKGSDYAYGDASFIRLKNVAISWELPKNWLKKISLQTCRFYVQGQNLLTITNYKGIDPESQGYGGGPLRVWTAGFHVTL